MNLDKIIDKIVLEKKDTTLGSTSLEQNLKNWYEEKKKLGWDKAINHRHINPDEVKIELLQIIKDKNSKVSDQTEKKYEIEIKKQKNVTELLFWVFSKLQVVYGNKVIK